MTARNSSFDEKAVLQELSYFLRYRFAAVPGSIHVVPAHGSAAPDREFFEALRLASEVLGYHTALSPERFRSLYNAKRVKPEVLERIVTERKGARHAFEWQDKALMKKFPVDPSPRIGRLREQWKIHYKLDADELIHPALTRIVGAFVDCGVADWQFPVDGCGLLDAMREVESKSFISFFKNGRVRRLLMDPATGISELLQMLVGDESLFAQYLFDQQFAHRTWSALVAWLEMSPDALPENRTISLHDLIVFELLLEIDALDQHFRRGWQPLATALASRPEALFAPLPASEKQEVMAIWQEAVEWSHYEQVLLDLMRKQHTPETRPAATDQPHAAGLHIIGRSETFQRPGVPTYTFWHPYDYSTDRPGNSLEGLLRMVVPQEGHLASFFAENDEQPADPAQVPMRPLFLVEQHPETVTDVLRRYRDVHIWFAHEWVLLAVLDPVSGELSVLRHGEMVAWKSERHPEGVAHE